MTTVVELLTRFRTLGVTLAPGPIGMLQWEADGDPAGELLDALAVRKPELLALLTLVPNLFERWEERACIMHFDGKILWQTAESLALTDVLSQADPRVGGQKTGWASETSQAEEAAPAIQGILFSAGEKGVYATC